MERRKFEDSFQDAFRDAEMNPSGQVWTNIELDLEKAEGDKMKRRLVFFKMLAAASVVFAMCIAGIGYYILNDQSLSTPIALQNDPIEEQPLNSSSAQEGIPGSDPDKTSSDLDKTSNSGAHAPANSKHSAIEKKDPDTEAEDVIGSPTVASRVTSPGLTTNEVNIKASKSNPSGTRESEVSTTSSTSIINGDKINSTSDISSSSEQFALITPPEENNGTSTGKLDYKRSLPAIYTPKEPELEFPSSNADPGMLLLARLDDEAKRYASQEKKSRNSSSEKLWTSLGFSAGSFSANNPSVTPQASNLFLQASNAQNTATKQSKASGMAYSVGVSMGTKLSERWVLQGGVNYMMQSSDYTANSVVVVDNNFDAPQAESLNMFTPRLTASADTKVAQTFPYNVNNHVRSVSVPLQAGYLLVNKKVGFQLNAGVSTDFFLENTISPDGGGVASSTVGRGSESPYRSLNFSGLMGTELSYRMGTHYRLSLNPGIRYPFNSIYKSNTGVDANPVTFDIGLRFRYIFN